MNPKLFGGIPMRSRKKIIDVTLVVTLASAILSLAMQTEQLIWIFTAVSIVLVVLLALEMILLWRCPSCGAFLGRMGNGSHCGHCGRDIYNGGM